MKIGRNELCPCGSGKKFKHCCAKDPERRRLYSGGSIVTGPPGAAASAAPAVWDDDELVSPDLFDLPLIDPMTLERELAKIGRVFERYEDDDEKLNAVLHELLETGELPEFEFSTPLEQAQDLVYQAWDADGPEQVRLATEALKISPDCADAYLLLGDETCDNAHDALEFYRKAVEASRRVLATYPEGRIGKDFELTLVAKQYIRTLHAEADALVALGRHDEAIADYWEVLRLDNDDVNATRYFLFKTLLERQDWGGARRLLDHYRRGTSALFSYGRALLTVELHGQGRQARRALDKAVKANRYVPGYLLSLNSFHDDVTLSLDAGDDAEGETVAALELSAWQAVPGALGWLAQSVAERLVPEQLR